MGIHKAVTREDAHAPGEVADFIDFQQVAAPSAPDAGVTRLYAKTDKSLYQKDEDGIETALGGGGGGGGGGRTLVAENTPSGTGTTSFTPSGTTKKVTIEFAVKSSQMADSVNWQMTFNGDTTDANYSYVTMQNNHAGLTSSSGNSRTFASPGVDASNANANEFSIGSIEIIQYGNTGMYKRAIIRWANLYQTGAFFQLFETAFFWRDAAAITQIDLVLGAGNYVAGSVLRHYEED